MEAKSQASEPLVAEHPLRTSCGGSAAVLLLCKARDADEAADQFACHCDRKQYDAPFLSDITDLRALFQHVGLPPHPVWLAIVKSSDDEQAHFADELGRP